LTLAVVQINGWNRLSISMRAVPGTYQPGGVDKMDKMIDAASHVTVAR
jgi:hypothetical protein